MQSLFHLADILFALSARMMDILWSLLLVSSVHMALLGLIWHAGKKVEVTIPPPSLQP